MEAEAVQPPCKKFAPIWLAKTRRQETPVSEFLLARRKICTVGGSVSDRCILLALWRRGGGAGAVQKFCTGAAPHHCVDFYAWCVDFVDFYT